MCMQNAEVAVSRHVSTQSVDVSVSVYVTIALQNLAIITNSCSAFYQVSSYGHESLEELPKVHPHLKEGLDTMKVGVHIDFFSNLNCDLLTSSFSW